MLVALAGVPDSSSYADGVGTSAEFDTPWGIAVSGAGAGSFALVVSTPWAAIFQGCSVRTAGSQADRFNFCIRRIDLTTTAVTTYVGNQAGPGYTDGVGTSASFQAPWGVTIDGAATFVLVVRSKMGAV